MFCKTWEYVWGYSAAYLLRAHVIVLCVYALHNTEDFFIQFWSDFLSVWMRATDPRLKFLKSGRKKSWLKWKNTVVNLSIRRKHTLWCDFWCYNLWNKQVSRRKMDPAGHQSRHNSSCAGPRRPEDLIRNKEQRRRERRERRARRQRRFYHGAGGPTAGMATNTFSFCLLSL